MNFISRYKKIITFVLLLFSLPLFLAFTDPNQLPLPLLVIPIILFFVIFFSTFYLLVEFVKPNIEKARRRTISSLLAVFPTLLIVLQSLKQLTTVDVLLVILIWVPLTWYLLKIDYLAK